MPWDAGKEDDLLLLDKKATPGPWSVSGQHGYFEVGPPQSGGWCKPILTLDSREANMGVWDADLAAKYRNAVPELIEEVRRLRKELSEYKEGFRELKEAIEAIPQWGL